MTCAGVDTLVIVVDALMAQVLTVSTALEVDVPKARAGIDSIVFAADAPMTHAGGLLVEAPKISAGAVFKVLAENTPIAYEPFYSMTWASEAKESYAGTDSRLVIVNAPLTCAGADTLVIVVDAQMAQVWAVSTALDVDAFQVHRDAGADWMCLFFAADAPTTHTGTVSMALIVESH